MSLVSSGFFFFFYWSHPVLFAVMRIISRGSLATTTGRQMSTLWKETQGFFKGFRVLNGELIYGSKRGLHPLGRDKDRGASNTKVVPSIVKNWAKWKKFAAEATTELQEQRPNLEALLSTLQKYKFAGLSGQKGSSQSKQSHHTRLH